MYLMMPTLPEGSKRGPLINACNFSRLLQVMIETLNKLQGTHHFEFSIDKLGQWMTNRIWLWNEIQVAHNHDLDNA